MDKTQLVQVIKENRKISYKEAKAQAQSAGVSLDLFEEAWKEARPAKKIQAGLIIAVAIGIIVIDKIITLLLLKLGSSLIENNYFSFISIGIYAFIGGLFIGFVSKEKKILNGLLTGLVSTIFYFFAVVPSGNANAKTFGILLISFMIPAIIGSVIGLLRK